jgi:CheY-like chemotaxis protein
MEHYILVIDDDDNMLALMSDLLALLGYAVRLCRDGFEAMIVLRQHPPMAVITDLCMPGMDGWELAEQLQSVTQEHRIPIVVVTGFPETKRLAASLGLPESLIVSKGVPMKDLCFALEAALNHVLSENPAPAA